MLGPTSVGSPSRKTRDCLFQKEKGADENPAGSWDRSRHTWRLSSNGCRWSLLRGQRSLRAATRCLPDVPPHSLRAGPGTLWRADGALAGFCGSWAPPGPGEGWCRVTASRRSITQSSGNAHAQQKRLGAGRWGSGSVCRSSVVLDGSAGPGQAGWRGPRSWDVRDPEPAFGVAASSCSWATRQERGCSVSPNKPNSSSGRALGGGDPGAVGRTGQGGQRWVCFIFFPHCDLEAAFKIKFSLRLSLGKAVFLLMLTCPGSDLSSFPP